MKLLLSYLKEYKKESILAPLFKMLEATFELFVPLVMASMIDKGIGGQDKAYILQMGLLLLLLTIIGLVCAVTAQYFAAKAAVRTTAKMREALFGHIQSLSYTEQDMIGTSTLITRLTSDSNQVQNFINMMLRLFLRSPFIVMGAMIMAFTIDVKAALIFVVTIPALAIVVFGVMVVTMPMYRRVQSLLDRVLGITRENLTGVRVIRAFHIEKEEEAAFREENEALTDLQIAAGKLSALTNPLTYVIVNVATLLLLYTGAVRVDTGVITQGEVVALVNYMSQILVELIKLANLIVLITKALACLKRIEDVFASKSSMGILESSSKEHDSEDGAGFSVVFDHVSLCYGESREEALSDISFKVKEGDTVGIIGGTGCGKTSLVNLIPRFYDAVSGSVKVFGQNVKEQDPAKLRGRIGVVPQKAMLFQGTIADNLRFGAEDATDEELWNALRIAQAEDFVREREAGLNAEVMQGGKNLSGGQRQRLTIARALVRKPEILILDDSASALDYATDAALRSAIRNMEKQMTTFIVSQRASSIMHADLILVLEDGELAGIGTHDSLLAECDVYREIYESQYSKEEVADA